MNILVITPEYPPFNVGGVGVHVEQLVKNLSAERNKIIVVSFSNKYNKNELEFDTSQPNLTVVRTKLPVENHIGETKESFLYQNNLIKEKITYLKEHNYLKEIELIVVHGYFLADAAIYAKETLNVPMVYHAHTIYTLVSNKEKDKNMEIHLAEKRLCQDSFKIIAVSQYLKELLYKTFCLESNKIVVISKGVDVKKFDSIENCYSEKFFKILFVGRISQEKGLEVLLLALKKLVSTALNKKIMLFIAGSASSELYLESVVKLVKTLSLQSSVVFLGQVSQENLIKEYKSSNLVVVPSYEETFGRVAIEAMAAKCPVIVSNVGGLGPIIKNNINGLKFEPGDYRELSHIIENLIRDASGLLHLKEQAYQDVCINYTIESVYERTKDIYKKIYGGKNEDSCDIATP